MKFAVFSCCFCIFLLTLLGNCTSIRLISKQANCSSEEDFNSFKAMFKNSWQKSVIKEYSLLDDKVNYSCNKKAEQLFRNWKDCLKGKSVSEIEAFLGLATTLNADNMDYVYHLGKTDITPTEGKSIRFILNESKDFVLSVMIVRWQRYSHE